MLPAQPKYVAGVARFCVRFRQQVSVLSTCGIFKQMSSHFLHTCRPSCTLSYMWCCGTVRLYLVLLIKDAWWCVPQRVGIIWAAVLPRACSPPRHVLWLCMECSSCIFSMPCVLSSCMHTVQMALVVYELCSLPPLVSIIYSTLCTFSTSILFCVLLFVFPLLSLCPSTMSDLPRPCTV